MPQVDTRETTSESLDTYARPKPGDYHCEVVDATEDRFDFACTVSFRILAGTTQGQAGLQHMEFLRHDGDTPEKTKFLQNRQLHFGIALGLITKDQVDGSDQLSFDFTEAIGKQVVIRLTEWENRENGKRGTQIDGFGIWALDDPAVASVPKDADAVAGMGVSSESLSESIDEI